jgi:hypothetical protein
MMWSRWRSLKSPFDANQAITTTLFERNQPQFHSRYPRSLFNTFDEWPAWRIR